VTERKVWYKGDMITDAERARRVEEDRKKSDLYVFDVDRADLLGPLGWLPAFQGTRTEVVGNWHFRFYVRVLGLDLLEPVEVQHPETGEPVGEFRRAGLLPDPAAEGVAGDEVLILEVEDLPFRLPSDGGISGPPAADEEAPERAGEDGLGETIPEEEQVEEGAEEAVAAAPDVVVPPLLTEDEIAAMDEVQIGSWLVDTYGLVPGSVPEDILDLPADEQREICRRVASDPGTVEKYRRAQAERERKKWIRETAPKRAAYSRTDAGNADRLVDLYGEDVRYCDTFGAWYIWSGKVWERDEKKRMLAISTEVAREIYLEANALADPERRQALGKWAATTENLSRRKAMIESAAPYCAIVPADLDAQPDLLNCPNGTLELPTLTFREHRRDDLLTKCCGAEYDPQAACPLWEAHLDRVFASDEEYILGFQELCGYSLLQDNPEQIIAILYGTGKNGKSVTTGTLSHVWGDYAANLSAESLMVKRGDGPRSDLARLKGVRLATSSEGDEGARLAESVVKQLTGDDTITVRRLYENEFEFRPGAKIFLATNHEPKIRGADEGIWRRIWLLPFVAYISEAERDPYIQEKLEAEAPGILNWCLQGLRRYYENGRRLSPPKKVVAATAAYRQESDVVGRFLSDETVPEMGREIDRSNLYKIYVAWCEDEGEKPVANRTFTKNLRDRKIKERKSNGTRFWSGIRLKTGFEKEDEDYAGSIFG